jgi:hypothetical protein
MSSDKKVISIFDRPEKKEDEPKKKDPAPGIDEIKKQMTLNAENAERVKKERSKNNKNLVRNFRLGKK